MTSKRELAAVLACSLTWGLAMLARTSMGYFALDMGLRASQLGWINFVTSLAYFFSAVWIGDLADRLGRHALALGLCLLASALFIALTGAAGGFAGLLAVRACVGFCFGPVYALTQAVARGAGGPRRFAINCGIITNGESVISTIAGPVLIVALMGAVGWRGAGLALAIPVLLLGGGWLASSRRAPGRPGISGDKYSIASLLRAPNIKVCLALGILSLTGLWIVYSYAPAFWTARGGLSEEKMSLLMTGMGVCTAAWCFALPALSGRVGWRGVIVPLGALSAAALLFCCLFPESRAAKCLFALFGGGASVLCIFAMAIVPARSVPGERAASAIAFVNGASELIGASCGPLIGGLIADSRGISAAMLFAGVCLLLLTAFGLRLREPRGPIV